MRDPELLYADLIEAMAALVATPATSPASSTYRELFHRWGRLPPAVRVETLRFVAEATRVWLRDCGGLNVTGRVARGYKGRPLPRPVSTGERRAPRGRTT